MTALPRALVVVGPGRVGSAIVRAAQAAGVPVDVVGRGDPGEALRSGAIGVPIVVCTRADDLADVIGATAPARHPDLVFVQNGMIRPLLEAHGLAGNTQGLIYFAATSRSGPVEAGAPSLFWGPHAGAMVALFAADGIPARVVEDPREFAAEIGTKLAWNLIFGLLGERYGESVGETITRRRKEIIELAAEVGPVLERGLDAELPLRALVDRLVAYSANIPTFRAAVRELPWRNGWIVEAGRRYYLATPFHDRLLRETGHLPAPSTGA